LWSLLAAYKHNCREVDPNLVADIAVSATLCQHCLPTHLSMRFVHPATILKLPRFQNCLYCAGSNGELFDWSYSAAICVQHVKLINYFIPTNALHYFSVLLSLHMFRGIPCAILRGVVESSQFSNAYKCTISAETCVGAIKH
jgi:hypothetical protein